MDLIDLQNEKLPSPKSSLSSTDEFTKYKCAFCNLGFYFIKDLQDHISDPSGIVIQCSKCDKKFVSEARLNQHYGKVHAKNRPVKCCVCKKKFRNKYAAKFHKQEVHEKMTRKTCEHCEKQFYNGYSLNRHKETCPVLKTMNLGI